MTLSSTARQIIFWLLIVAGALLLYKLVVNPTGRNCHGYRLIHTVHKDGCARDQAADSPAKRDYCN